MTQAHTITAALTAILLSNCSSDQDHPAELLPSVKDSKTCGDIRTGTAEKGRVLLAGEVARCAPNGLACALNDVPAFDAACDANRAVEAQCIEAFWTLTCQDSPDAGPPKDAADASD